MGKMSLLQRSVTRFQTSSAYQSWQRKRAAIASRMIPLFQTQVVNEGTWSSSCDRDKYKAWISVQSSPLFLGLVRFAPEKCSEVEQAFLDVNSKCGRDVNMQRADVSDDFTRNQFLQELI